MVQRRGERATGLLNLVCDAPVAPSQPHRTVRSPTSTVNVDVSQAHRDDGTSPTAVSGAAGSCCGRVEHRAVGPRLRIYFVSIRPRPTVALARSAAALGGLREVAEILIISDMIRVGKGF